MMFSFRFVFVCLCLQGFILISHAKIGPQKKSQSSKIQFSNQPLLNSTDLLQLNEQEKEKYFDALREFFDENQPKNSTFSSYFLEALGGELFVQAASGTETSSRKKPGADAWSACDTAIYQNVKFTDYSRSPIRTDPDCYDKWLGMMNKGELGDCSFNYDPNESGHSGKGHTSVTCRIKNANDETLKEREYPFWGLSQDSNDQIKEISKSGSEHYKATDLAEQKIKALPLPESNREVVVPNDSASPRSLAAKRSDAATGEDKKQSMARCFYAGFVIAKNSDGKSKCSGVDDVCSEKLQLRGTSQTEVRKALGCDEKPSKLKSTCGNGKNPLANQVVCNPLLFGLSGKDPNKSVLCVRKSKNASADCGELLKKDPDAKENLKKLLEGKEGKSSFDSLVKEIETQCSPYWNFKAGDAHNLKDSDLKKRTTSPARQAQAPKSGAGRRFKGGNGTTGDGALPSPTQTTQDTTADPYERKSDTYKGDFQKTCQVLLNQVGDLKKSILSSGSGTSGASGSTSGTAGTK